MPKQDEGKYALTAELQNGTDLAKAERIAKELEEIIKSDPHTQSYLMLVSTSRISINANVGKKNTPFDRIGTNYLFPSDSLLYNEALDTLVISQI